MEIIKIAGPVFGTGAAVAVAVGCCLFATGCAVTEVEQFAGASRIRNQPAQWTAKGTHRSGSEAVTGWVRDFNSPVLERLIGEAVENNFALQAALYRVFQAEERAKVSRSGLFPQFDLGENTSRGQAVSQQGQIPLRRHSMFLAMSWEIDLWRRLHDLKQSQIALMDAQYNAWQAARLSLAASVLRAAFEAAESAEQIALAQRNLQSLQTNLEILDAKLEAGDADDRTALEITLSRSDIARARSNVVAERQQRDEALRILEALLGRYPRGKVPVPQRLPEMKRSVPVGLPGELLLRRPDVLQAEMVAVSSLYGVSAARKQLLPAVRLTGDIGTDTSTSFSDLFDIENLVWSLTRGVTQPVFHAGEIRSQIRLSENERDELIAAYADSVLVAFREVEVALAGERYFNEQVEALRINVREARRAEELSLANYEKGLIDILTLLESQRRSFDAQSSLLDIRLRRLLNRVDLYLALGGDFDNPPVPVACPVEEDGQSRSNRQRRWKRRIGGPGPRE